MDSLIPAVEAILRDVAQTEVLSRFGKLKREEIRAKSSRQNDLVTTADIEAENRLIEALSKLLPDSTFIGEEETANHPEILDRLHGDAPVWTIDPLDGTGNFAKGKPCFAMICALVQGGETHMGWIYDPIAEICVTAEKGKGVFLGEQKLSISEVSEIERMTGSLGDGLRARLQKRKENGETGLPQQLVRYHCCGREYLDLLLGKIHFALYGGNLMPWDHAAGVLMVEEAGGYGRTCAQNARFDAARYGKGEHLLLAPNEQAFGALQSLVCPR